MASTDIELLFTNPTDFRHEVRDLLPVRTTAEAMVREILLIRMAVDDPITIAIIDKAIQDEVMQHYEYLANLRRFYEIALPKVIRREYYHQGAFKSMHQDVFESLQYLMAEIDFCDVDSIGDKKQVFVNLKRQWRWLGCPTAPYEPLYEFVLDRPLLNE
ncbi:MAG: hypothetical protein L6R41_005236 [Letrouitia leprolyta]|nr:MAG: hypothetical protein L6R41_005236 [Letrouitia leprolyta]